LLETTDSRQYVYRAGPAEPAFAQKSKKVEILLKFMCKNQSHHISTTTADTGLPFRYVIERKKLFWAATPVPIF
jgi:hypothetical protein